MSPISAFLLVAVLQQAGPPDRIRLAPSELEVAVDRTRSVDATVLDADGDRVDRAVVRWFMVEGEDVAEVDARGRVTALRPGGARVAAVSGQAVSYLDVTVPQLPPTDVSVSLPDGRLLQGTSAPLEIRAVNRLGDSLPRPRLSYRSANPAVARVDEEGRVFGRAPGTARIVASSPTSSAEVAVEVESSEGWRIRLTPVDPDVRTGDVIRFRAVADGPGGERRLLHPAWSVTGDGADVEQEGGEGVFVAEEPGSYRLAAGIGEDEIRSAELTVEPREYDSRLLQVGRGAVSSHHSGDMWAFEGVDGRDYVYLGTFLHDWMKVWDVTDPTSPTLTDSIRVDARRINDVKIHPDRPIGIITREGASDRRNGLVLLDLAEPARPTILSEYEETLTGGVHNVWIDGENELVYAVHDGTMDLHILDISDPRAVREVGRWGLDRAVKTLHDVIVQDGYAYLSYWNDGLVILDAGAGSHGGTPREPAFVSRISYPEGNTHVAWRHGDYVFVGDEIFPVGWDPSRPVEARGYIHVIDVSDLENPRQVARYEVPEAGAHNVWVEDDRLYVGYYQAGMRVVDVSGELRGDLYAQGREIASFRPIDGEMVVPNWPMTWGAQPFKGNIFSSDLNSGLWVTRLQEEGETVF